MGKGSVSLVGAGCGDPEFLTVKAKNRLERCEVLVYDSLVSERIVEQVPADCEKIYVGKRYGRHAMKQEEINDLLIRKAQEGKRVVRLKGGDPYVFGRGGEEFMALMAEGIACEEIPGITSCVAVPAAAGIPVTHRGKSRSFTVITGTTAQENGQEGLQMDFGTLAGLEGTLVILMGVHHLEEIAEGLMQAGKDAQTPCAVIMEGTLSGQRCVRAPLSEIAAQAEKAGIKPPAVIVIGAVAQMELLSQKNDAEWTGSLAGCEGVRETEKACGQTEEKNDTHRAERKMLSGVTVGVTGTQHFAEKLSCALQEKGAAICDMSFMEIRENLQVLPQLGDYGWLVFTSPNGVRIFLDKMKREKRDLRSIALNRIAVIGPGTAQALEEVGIYADYMPQIYNAEHLAEGLTQRILEVDFPEENGLEGHVPEEIVQAGKPVLFLRASQGSEALPHIFEKKDILFAEFPLYEIGVNEEKRNRMMAEKPDYVVFGAGSGVRAYFGEMGQDVGGHGMDLDSPALNERAMGEGVLEKNAVGGKRPRYVCMGEACGRELARFTEEEFLVAKESSIAGIVECICSDLNRIRR